MSSKGGKVLEQDKWLTADDRPCQGNRLRSEIKTAVFEA
jgi:hypothetical protein